MTGKRWLFLSHRWLGIPLSLFMAPWFLSGVVMMYVGYPKLTQMEHLRASHPLAEEGCCSGPATLIAGLTHDMPLKSLRLIMVAGQPRLIAITGKKSVAIDARTGAAIPPTSVEAARASAVSFAPEGHIESIEKISEDAWTHSKALDPHRPLFRIILKHPELAALYVSGTTGEVIRDVSITETYWNWLGAWLHWLYPFRGGILDAWWSNIVIYSSLLGSILAVAGIVIGIMRWRIRGYPSGSCSPYRKPLMRWHHAIGLVSGFFILAWVVSGLFSVNPWKIFDSGATKPLERNLEQRLLAKDFDATAAIGCLVRTSLDIRELEWIRHKDRLHVLARDAQNQVRVLRDPRTCEITDTYTTTEIQNEAMRLMPHARIISSELQVEYGWHYYAREPHTMTGGFEKPLPVLVVKFDDPHFTWLYFDLKTSRIVQRSDDYGRIKRLLFNFLHSWDWKVLLDHRPLWDALLIAGSIAGFLVSLTAMVLGWKRLWR